MSDDDLLVSLARDLETDPVIAHEVLFKGRHPDETPDFHKELIRLYHDEAEPNVLALAFRGSGKSTLAEETLVLLAASGRVKNVLIVADSWVRACDRLRAIRRELETNEWLEEVYGPQEGETWTESRLVLANGCSITAHGQGQALRGMKHLSYRPDLCFVDDLESADTVATPEARRKLGDWFWSDLKPALDPKCRMLVAATPLDPEALAVVLSKMPEFKTVTIPIEYVDEEGGRRSAWPSRFPLEAIDKLKQTYVSAGKSHLWASEYMVQAVDPSTRLFLRNMFRFDPGIQRTWEPVYIAYDPARTVEKSSATTGYVAASWVGRRLIIWESGGKRWQPAQLIDDIFAKEERYEPVVIGVEKDGLSEWIEQPLRQEQIKRSRLLPIRALKAPKGKLDFIQRLQPLFAAGDIVFAGSEQDGWVQETIEQFLAFPSGVIDIPNAFAYLLSEQMRGGQPVYEDAGQRHIAADLSIRPGPVMLAVNAGGFGTTGVLFQYKNLILTILSSWAMSGDPGQSLSAIIAEARLFAGRAVTVVAPPQHFDLRDGFGMRAAIRGVAELRKGGDVVRGREMIRMLFRTEAQGCPRLLIGPDALWARRALLGGFVREEGKLEPKPSLYQSMIEGLESAIGAATMTQPNVQQMMATTADGVSYQTAEIRRH